MKGYLALILHAHLPFVRHPRNERHLEELWLFEAVTETYLPLLEAFEALRRENLSYRLAISFSPTLCAMLQDPLLQQRCAEHLDALVELADKEIHRTRWEEPYQRLALFYHQRWLALRGLYDRIHRDIPAAFSSLEAEGRLELITTSATHAVLPLLQHHPPSIRAQLLVARDSHRACFKREPRGIWLPECAYFPGLEEHLAEAGLRWFVLDTHGVLRAQPRPSHATFAPILTPRGVAAFGRDHLSARQVWSRHEGYPGDPRYREFYRDAGFDLDLEYVQPHLYALGLRGFTGLKYHRVTGSHRNKEVYDRTAALEAVRDHASHFISQRATQVEQVRTLMDRPPILVAPYDAELFGHWWFEGPDFLKTLLRQITCSPGPVSLLTPGDYLGLHPVNEVAMPTASTWGEAGHLGMWLNEDTEWMFRALQEPQRQLTRLANEFPAPTALERRILNQAARELLLAQSSDWAFIIRSRTSPDYARSRFESHLRNFQVLAGGLPHPATLEKPLAEIEEQDCLFPEIRFEYWR